ncbi:MAG: CoA pyrophosphatase [Thermodesulfobacteriota bacterium]
MIRGSEGPDSFFAELKRALTPADRTIPPPAALRQAGVLVPLFADGKEIRVVLTRRTERVPHHKGQVCFPGGSRDAGDPDLLATALRESEEELGIRPEVVEVIGSMEPVPTVTGFFIQPFVVRIPAGSPSLRDEFEVAELFDAPLSAFTDFSLYRSAETTFLGQPYLVYFLDYGRHAIWGATARILHDLAGIALRIPGVRRAAG